MRKHCENGLQSTGVAMEGANLGTPKKIKEKIVNDLSPLHTISK